MSPLQLTLFPRTFARTMGGLVLLAMLILAGLRAQPIALGQEKPGLLTSRAAPARPPVSVIKVGQDIATGAGERRMLQLPDGAILFVNQQTQAKLAEAGQLTLDAGEVYVEVPVSKARNGPLKVVTPQKELAGIGSHFGVRVDKAGTGVVVARGSVKVKGIDDKLFAGQQLSPGGATIESAPRLSQVFDWTRELMLAAESPLVPGSEHAGGALVAVDPNGQQAKLELRKFHIDVHIEDGFARTTIDQTYFNQQAEQLEGTFYFPLPPDASLSRLAMYVNGVLMEGGMAERDHARQTYERIRYYNRDPALLEWVDGSTFKMRVFPIEARQEKRLVLSYSQVLPNLNGQMQYRFPAGHSLQKVGEWSVKFRVVGGKDFEWSSPSHTLTKSVEQKDLVLKGAVKSARTDKDVVLSLSGPLGENPRYSSTKHEGERYLMVRYRPDFGAVNAKPQAAAARDWVFLFEASGDRDPLLARVQIDVIRHLLHHAGPDDRFTVLTANTRVKAWSKELLPVNTENVLAALAFLESTHLVGALDLGQALAEVEFLVRGPGNPNRLVVHVGSGIPAMGERRHRELMAPVAQTLAHYVGIGVGRRWERSFMKEAARRTAGHFTQINPDEPIAWRAFELFASLNEPRLMNVSVSDGSKATYHVLNHTVARGEEICAIAQLANPEFPETLIITGELDGKPWRKEVAVKKVTAGADYLPRTWAKLEIDRLLAEDAMKHKAAIVALSKAMYVMTPFTSLLVLENDDMYAQYKVDRGRKDHWAMYPAPAKIEVVYEPLPGMPDPKSAAGKKPSVKEVLKTLTLGAEEKVEVQIASAGAISSAPGMSSNHHSQIFSFSMGFNNGAKRTPVELGVPLFEQAALPYSGALRPQPLGVLPDRYDQYKGSIPLNTLLNGEGKVSDSPFTGRRVVTKSVSVLRQVDALQKLAPAPLPPSGITAAVPMNDASLALADPVPFLDVFGRPARLAGGKPANPNFLYRRPSVAVPASAFFDLTAYAPGMSMTLADVQAVVEAEARPSITSRPGQIDAGARRLFDKARSFRWRAWTLPAEKGRAKFTIYFDGVGKYAYEHETANGIRERVVCDGKTLLHLYPQLGIGARRDVSRFHRADLADTIPWFVPSPEDLAHGADVKLIAERIVAVIPLPTPRDEHSNPAGKTAKDPPISYQIHFVFAADGNLTERQLVKMPKGEVISRRVIASDGTVRSLDAKGKEVDAILGTLILAEAPDLTGGLRPSARLENIVVLPLPYRTADHVLQVLKDRKVDPNDIRFEDALPLFAAYYASGNANDANRIFRSVFHAREQRQVGFYVLLAACGMNLDSQNGDVLAEHLDNQVAQYLALHSSPVLRKHASQWALNSDQWQEGALLKHLGQTHAILQRWESAKVLKGDRAKVQLEIRRAIEYVNKHKSSEFAWALLCQMQDRADELAESALSKELPEADRKDRLKLAADLQADLAKCWELFVAKDTVKAGSFDYAARYQSARSLFLAGQKAEARKRYQDLYERALKDKQLPAIDHDFRQALATREGAGATDAWTSLMTKTTAQLIAQKHRRAVLALARQCWALGDQALAQHLLELVRAEPGEDKERVPLILAQIDFLSEMGQIVQADRLLQDLLSEPDQAKRPDLWRLAGKLAERRDMPARSIEHLEKALDLEFRKLPEVLDLAEVRAEYGSVLDHYASLADAMVALKIDPPAGFLTKVVKTADRWRAMDPEQTAACRTVAGILQRLGERDLDWDYLTTPIGLNPNEADPWHDLAETLARKGDLKLADRAFLAAFQAEPTNAQYLWDRAQNLYQSGELKTAQTIYRQLADGTWQPRFQGVQAQARLRLQGK